MNVLLVTSEVTPFSKTGGLGDVCGALASALARAGHRVATLSPRYGTCDPEAHGAVSTGVRAAVPAAGAPHEVEFLRVVDDDGVHHLLVEHPMFDRAGLYGDVHGTFGDNHLRFAVLCRAALEAALSVPVGEAPFGEDVLFHAHDWQAALLPVLLQAESRPRGVFRRSPCILTLHNVAHQGRFPGRLFEDLDLPPRWFSPWALEYYSDLNLLKGGILHADQITTVSPTFATEIRTQVGGFGLDGVLRSRSADLTGILNGIDDDWDPRTDPFLPATFGPGELAGKARCKAALQEELDLEVDPEVPLLASIGRLDPQKGPELTIESLPWLVQSQEAQIAVLGSAVPTYRAYEDRLRDLEARFPGRVRAWIGFSEALAHRIEAGADLFLMPSRFEPCGLNQLYSMRYGTPPVVRATGGLADSVEEADPDGTRGTGWRFHMFDGHSYREALFRALDCWRERPAAFRAIQARGMARDSTWDAVVPDYLAVYERARERRLSPA